MYQQTVKNVIFGLQSHHRAVIYLIASVCLSNFCDFTNKSESYFAKQNNILNIYFVKYSWGWTLLSLGLYLLAKAIEKARIEGDFNNFIKILLQTSARLLIATLVWYLGTECNKADVVCFYRGIVAGPWICMSEVLLSWT